MIEGLPNHSNWVRSAKKALLIRIPHDAALFKLRHPALNFRKIAGSVSLESTQPADSSCIASEGGCKSKSSISLRIFERAISAALTHLYPEAPSPSGCLPGGLVPPMQNRDETRSFTSAMAFFVSAAARKSVYITNFTASLQHT
jgi:hypothetical protein